jgi:glycosyltransferase involved in cell wall biosynthesis
MNILIADFDLFHLTGGGQTFYRNIINKNPQLNFYYFVKSESLDSIRLPNAYPIVYRYNFLPRQFNPYTNKVALRWFWMFIEANNIVSSLAKKFPNTYFDVVEVPDYNQLGVFLRPALIHFKVKYDRIVLSMHGRISTSIQLNWFDEDRKNLSLDLPLTALQEQMQYKTVDIRYGISEFYLDEWKQISDIGSYYLNPFSFLTRPFSISTTPSVDLPDINFIGRLEKRKSPEVFAELAWWLKRSSFNKANIIGSDCYSFEGDSAKHYLQEMINHRSPEINICPSLNQKQLADLFSTRSITFVPSRYDTLNLVALESLLAGCPTAIGTGAGVCRFLKESLPQVPFIPIDIDNIYASISSIQLVLEDYDKYRQNLVEILKNSNFDTSGLTLEEIYKSPSNYDRSTSDDLDEIYNQIMGYYHNSRIAIKSTIGRLIKPVIPIELHDSLRFYRSKFSKSKLQAVARGIISNQRFSQSLAIPLLLKNQQSVFDLPENTDAEVEYKIKSFSRLGNRFQINRVATWKELARLERLSENDLVATTYELRIMRSQGKDIFNKLPSIIKSLNERGFEQEATVAEAMYGSKSEEQSREACKAILDEALERNRINHQDDGNYEIFDDRRIRSDYKISVIVSLYNAASKLPQFLTALKLQTLMQKGLVEVILVDSGSPTDEYRVFQELVDSLAMPIIYVRSAKRETIQSAWNRGISLSRSPYLTFLGVDETILPTCLEILSAELDGDPDLDWIQANSLVTSVDEHGTIVSDVMVYDRTDYQQDLVYLETCYLSWVGSLYRHSIHERFGYYDPSFTAAGDTEFKGRVLPFIKTKAIPRTLGLFWNYPEERTTQHPRAEIEDLRAWYLHRTVGGIEYAFKNREISEAEQLFYLALGYRKSYVQHSSTDIEYAYNMAKFLQTRNLDPLVADLFQGVNKLMNEYRLLDCLPSSHKAYNALQVIVNVGNIEREHRQIASSIVKSAYKVFNDNRYEQHSYFWTT